MSKNLASSGPSFLDPAHKKVTNHVIDNAQTCSKTNIMCNKTVKNSSVDSMADLISDNVILLMNWKMQILLIPQIQVLLTLFQMKNSLSSLIHLE